MSQPDLVESLDDARADHVVGNEPQGPPTWRTAQDAGDGKLLKTIARLDAYPVSSPLRGGRGDDLVARWAVSGLDRQDLRAVLDTDVDVDAVQGIWCPQ